MKNRGNAMGSEHRDKGVDVQLGPVAGPIGRSPEGGRNWEGMSTQLELQDVISNPTSRLQS
jgi:beta-glucosidase-like glycosyl hydrolase